MGSSRRGRRAKPVSELLATAASETNPGACPLWVRHLRWIALSAIVLSLMVYVGSAWTPSHYSLGLRRLGVEAQPVIGSARQIRTDEWMVLTPMTQLAVRGGFKTHDQVSPYGQSLKGFLALPIADWSLAFKPQFWAYWAVPPAYAYSVYWAIMWCSMLAGYSVLLWKCRVPFALAALGAVILWMTHYVQVWWTGPAPLFALAPWPAVVLVSGLRPLLRWPLFTYSAAIWIFGGLYPPYQIPTVLALGALVLGLRKDVFTIRSVVMICLSAVVVIAVAFAYFHDLAEIMRRTVYPGSRVSGGGGVPLVQLAAHVLPFVSTWQFIPAIARSNECEVAVVSSALPLLLIACSDYRSVVSELRKAGWPLGVIGVLLALMLAWIALPIPSQAGRILLWHYVPSYRMTWAFGMLLTLSLVVLLSRVRVSFTLPRIGIFCMAMAVSWLAGQRLAADSAQRIPGGNSDWFEFAAMAAVVGVWVCVRIVRRAMPCGDQMAIATAAAMVGAVTFGTFNPIQSAHDIFTIPNSQRQEEFREQMRSNPNGWLIAPGMYGAILNGAGITAINHCVPAPQLEFFRAIFPEMPAGEFSEVFNRYANIMGRSEQGPRLLQSDAIIVPIDTFMKPQPEAAAIGRRQRVGEVSP